LASLDVQVEGLDSLLKVLNRYEDLMEPASDAVEVYLQKTVFDAQAIVPVRTGTLQRSIMYWGSQGDFHVGSRVYYAPFVEFGTYRMRPRPYLIPSLLNNILLLRQYLRDLIEEFLRRNRE